MSLLALIKRSSTNPDALSDEDLMSIIELSEVSLIYWQHNEEKETFTGYISSLGELILSETGTRAVSIQVQCDASRRGWGFIKIYDDKGRSSLLTPDAPESLLGKANHLYWLAQCMSRK